MRFVDLFGGSDWSFPANNRFVLEPSKEKPTDGEFSPRSSASAFSSSIAATKEEL